MSDTLGADTPLSVYRDYRLVGGTVNHRHLCEVFGIGRQQASKDINNYKRSIGPANLEYDATAKGYRPTPQFTPRVSLGTTEEYLDIVAGTGDIQQLGRLPGALARTDVLSATPTHPPPFCGQSWRQQRNTAA